MLLRCIQCTRHCSECFHILTHSNLTAFLGCHYICYPNLKRKPRQELGHLPEITEYQIVEPVVLAKQSVSRDYALNLQAKTFSLIYEKPPTVWNYGLDQNLTRSSQCCKVILSCWELHIHKGSCGEIFLENATVNKYCFHITCEEQNTRWETDT